MAENDNETQWSDNANVIIEDIAPDIKDKYNIDLKDLLMKPEFYVSKKGIEVTVDNINEDINNYMADMESSMQDDKKDFEKDGLKCDAVSKQLSQNISMQAKQNNIPLIKPLDIERDTEIEEVIQINNIDNGVMALISKLSSLSNFIADFSSNYKTYSMGRWLFDGKKNYVVNVSLEPNAYAEFDIAREEITALVNNVRDYLKQQGKPDETGDTPR